MKHATVTARVRTDASRTPIRIRPEDLPKERAVLPPLSGGFHSPVRGTRLYRRTPKHKSSRDW